MIHIGMVQLLLAIRTETKTMISQFKHVTFNCYAAVAFSVYGLYLFTAPHSNDVDVHW